MTKFRESTVTLSAVGAIALMVGASGCLVRCIDYERTTSWHQADVKVPPNFGIEFREGTLWGGLAAYNDTLVVTVYQKDHPVSHEQIVDYAHSLVQANNLPEPTLAQASEWAGCGDSW